MSALTPSIFPTSDRKIEANRLNASKSTGPRTVEGKRRSSRNALTLGMFARELLVPGEDPGEFRAFKCGILRRLNPRDALELQMVERVVSAYWKIKRLEAAERLRVMMWGNWVREQHRCPALRSDPGWEHRVRHPHDPQKLFPPTDLPDPVPPAVALELLIREDDQAIDRIHRYIQRLDASARRNLKQLRKLRELLPDEGEPNDFTAAMLEEDEPDGEGAQPRAKGEATGDDPDDAAHSTRAENAESPCHDDDASCDADRVTGLQRFQPTPEARGSQDDAARIDGTKPNCAQVVIGAEFSRAVIDDEDDGNDNDAKALTAVRESPLPGSPSGA